MARPRAFTLIELLIVVAIIAILAAIAVPNFLEAQVRTKVSRTRADMRSLATAIESYHIDHGAYAGSVLVNDYLTINLTPGSNCTPRINALVAFTTPVAHVTSAFLDVFNRVDTSVVPGTSDHDQRVLIYYGPDYLLGYDGMDFSQAASIYYSEYPDVAFSGERIRTPLWTLHSLGPDQDLDFFDPPSSTTGEAGPDLAIVQPYDSTNGTISDGDIVRFRE